MHLERGPCNRTAHLHGRPTTRLEAGQVGVKPVVKLLAPLLAAVITAPMITVAEATHPRARAEALARPAQLPRREARVAAPLRPADRWGMLARTR